MIPFFMVISTPLHSTNLGVVFEDLDDMPLSVSVASFRHQDVEQPSMPKLELGNTSLELQSRINAQDRTLGL